MSRKVFISFLGTGNYVQTMYSSESTSLKPARFIQEYLLDESGVNYDKILIFCTEKARQLNWQDNGHPEKTIKENVERIGLETVLKSKPYWDNVEMVPIQEGFTTDEIREIFDCVYCTINAGDEIYFDVTHAFRSIPLFSTVLFNFSRFLKGTKLVKIYYGAFERLGPAFEVRQMPLAERKAPVLELSEIIQLQQLTQVGYDIKEHGRIGDIADTFCSTTSNNRFRNIVGTLQCMSSKLREYISTNRVEQIERGQFVREIQESVLQVTKNPNTSSAQKEVLQEIEKGLSKFKVGGGKENIIAAIEWALKYDMIQQAYTLAQELVITLGAEAFQNYMYCDNDVKWRNFISSIFAVSDRDIAENHFEGELAKQYDLTQQLLGNETVLAIRKSYAVIASNRNILSHGKKSTLTLSQFKNQLNKHFPICLNAIKNVH